MRRRGTTGATAMPKRLSVEELIAEKFRGIRPAYGYPACPDHSEKFKLFDLLDAQRQGHHADRARRDAADGQRQRLVLLTPGGRVLQRRPDHAATSSSPTRSARAYRSRKRSAGCRRILPTIRRSLASSAKCSLLVARCSLLVARCSLLVARLAVAASWPGDDNLSKDCESELDHLRQEQVPNRKKTIERLNSALPAFVIGIEASERGRAAVDPSARCVHSVRPGCRTTASLGVAQSRSRFPARRSPSAIRTSVQEPQRLPYRLATPRRSRVPRQPRVGFERSVRTARSRVAAS